MNILYLTNNKAENLLELPSFMEAYGDKVEIYFEKIDEKFIISKKIEFIVSDRYQYIIKKDVIELMKNKIINLHPSYLPWNRGYHSNFWSHYHNTPYGVSIHYVDEGIDTGKIIAQKRVFFNKNQDTLKTCYKKLRINIVELFFNNWVFIRDGKVKVIRHEFKGSHHFKKELDNIFSTLPKGWDTVIKDIIKLGRNNK